MYGFRRVVIWLLVPFSCLIDFVVIEAPSKQGAPIYINQLLRVWFLQMSWRDYRCWGVLLVLAEFRIEVFNVDDQFADLRWWRG